MKPPLRTILRNFLNHFEDYEARKKLCDDQYENEFQELKKLTDKLRDDPDYFSSCGWKDVNRPKNRYKDIVPYDKSRVVLPKCDGVPGSDYINASYVKGASGAFAYIAAQGPLPNTVIDFWRMIWICDVQVLVMACNEMEAGRNKCEMYWPIKGEVKHYGNISIELINTSQVCPDFLVRTFLVNCGSEMRDVYQFHYTSWPDHGVPEAVYPILHLVRLMRDCQATEIMPILVHCSAGCGRTGTICAVDYVWACLRQGKLSDDFSLFQIALELRRQRIAMIQTKEQYILAHKAVATLFEQQLSVIDCHTYANVDEDGEPLMWKELSKNKFPPFKKESSTTREPFPLTNNAINENSDENSPLLKGSENNKDSSDMSTNIAMVTSPSDTGDDVQDSKTNISDSLVSVNKNSESSFSRNSYLSLQSNEDSIPFIDDDEVCVRPNCGRAYLNIPSCDSISKLIHRFDPFADKVIVETDDSSPESEQKVFSNSRQINGKDCDALSVQDLNTKSVDLSLKPNYLTLPVKKSDNQFESNNRDSYPADKFHGDSISDLANESSDSLKVSRRICKGDVIRRPSIAKLKALFEKTSIPGMKSLNEGGKRSLFRNRSQGVSRAGSAPPSLNCMDQNSATERESVLMMVTRKFRSASVRTEREISSNSDEKSDSKKNNHSNFKEGFATLSRTVSFNLTKTLRSYSLSKAKVEKSPPIIECNRVSSTTDGQNSITTLPELRPKGKSVWYDKSSLPRAVAVVRPTEKVDLSIKTPTQSPTVDANANKPDFNLVKKTPRLAPFLSALKKSNGKDSTMWYGESDEINETNSATEFVEPSHIKSPVTRVFPFINSISPWKKVTSKSPLSSPDSPKSLAKVFFENNVNSSKFYTQFDELKNEPQAQPAVTPVTKEALYPIALLADIESFNKNEILGSTLDAPKDGDSTVKLPFNTKPIIVTNSLNTQVEIRKTKSTPKADVPPAIPRKTVVGKKQFVNPLHLEEHGMKLPENKSLANSKLEGIAKSVPSSPKDHYMNVNVTAIKNIEQIENTLRNNPRSAIIDLTSRESYCMEEELNNALKQLSKPPEDRKPLVFKKTSKYPGYEVIWPEITYPKDGVLRNDLKAGFCYSPPIRRSVRAELGLSKSHSCSNINCIESEVNIIAKQPSSSPTKQLVNKAVVDLNALLDQLTTRTLSEEPRTQLLPADKKEILCSQTAAENENLATVTLVSKGNVMDSPSKEEEIVFHFPPPPPLPPPDDGEIAGTFNIMRKNGSLVVSEISKSKDIATCMSPNSDDVSCTNDPNLVMPKPTPRKTKQPSPSLQRSASYSNVFPHSVKGKGYENVFLEKYQTLSRLRIETEDDKPKEATPHLIKPSDLRKILKGERGPDYVNIDGNFFSKINQTPNSCFSSQPNENPGCTEFGLQLSPTYVLDDSADSQHSTYGKIYRSTDKKFPTPDKRHHQYVKTKNIFEKSDKKLTPLKIVDTTQSDSIHSVQDKSLPKVKSVTPKKLPSRKHERAPLPPPLLQKNSSAVISEINLPNTSYYGNFPSRTLAEETRMLPALRENITNTEIQTSATCTNLGMAMSRDGKSSSLSHSQSDASVFQALKERKSHAYKDLNPKPVKPKVLKQYKELVSSSDSDGSYEFFDKVREQFENSSTNYDSKEQTTSNLAQGNNTGPIAPPRSKRRNAADVPYAKVKTKEGIPAITSSSNIRQQKKHFERLCSTEPPPAIPLKTKDAFEFFNEFGNKGISQISGNIEEKKSSSVFQR